MTTSPAALLGRAEFALADAVSRACDARSRVAEAHQAKQCGNDAQYRQRAASARRMVRDLRDSVKKAEDALLALGVDEPLREAKTGAPRLRIVTPTTRQPDDPGPCVA